MRNTGGEAGGRVGTGEDAMADVGDDVVLADGGDEIDVFD